MEFEMNDALHKYVRTIQQMQDDYFKILVHSRLSYRQNVDSTGGSGIIIRAVPLGFEAGADLVNKVAILVDKPACCDAARDATCDVS